MTKFYVKITEELPSVDEKALWFEIDSDLQDSKEFFVLSRNEYNTMHDEFIQAKSNLENSEVLATAINDMMSSSEFIVPNSDKAVQIIDPNNGNNTPFNWASLTSSFNNLVSSIQELRGIIGERVTTSQLSSAVNSLTNSINGKANASHTHNGWTYLKLNDYSSIYYNNEIKMCYFRYYRSSYNFTKTGGFTLHSGLIPSAYRPRGDIVLPFFHFHLVGYIDQDTGNFQISSDTKTSYAINTSAIWSYK